MRTLRAASLLLALLPAACVTPPPAFTFSTPGLNVTVGGDMDMWSLNMAQWAFAASSRLAGRPVEAARASAALEYLTVAVNAPRWAAMNPLTKFELERGRAQLRETLGIPADAPSQPVIQSLLDCGNALAAGDMAAAEATLRTPYFTFGPERTLAILNDMPFLRQANIATMHAGMNASDGGSVWRR
jgi:hypothetical protein